MRLAFVIVVLLATSCITATRALDIATRDHAEALERSRMATLEKAGPHRSADELACLVRTARENAFVDRDGDGISVTLRPSDACSSADGGAAVPGECEPAEAARPQGRAPPGCGPWKRPGKGEQSTRRLERASNRYGSVQYRITSTGRIAERRFMQ
jgi:hypothetical protein